MTEPEILQIISIQKEFFAKGATLPVQNRLSALRGLKQTLKSYESQIYDALKKDLGKSQGESYMCELGMVYSEISYMLRHTPKFSREKTVITPLAQFASHSYVKPSPKGTVLIMSPWNYPFMLTFDPLADAIAAGNTVILKPSAYAPATCKVIEKIVKDAFPPELVSVVNGGREENQCLLEQEFDHIFFTGSQAVGKEVLRKAAEHLTPSTLELGGKSPCIVDETANLRLAAKRIVFGKFLNCGQTCVAPDYICCERSVASKLLEYIKAEIRTQYGNSPLNNEEYGKIINRKHFDRLTSLIDNTKVEYGGNSNADFLKIEPTIAYPCAWDDKIMEDEIFGPILPFIIYDSLVDTLNIINSRPHPLALYIFSENSENISRITSHCPFGGGCINDTIIHLATTNMGFGGFGASGMGAYHGKTGFDTFSHRKSIVDKKTWLDLPMRYHPYNRLNEALVKLFLK